MTRKIKSADEFIEEFIYYRYTHPVRRKKPAEERHKGGPASKFNVDRAQLIEMYINQGMTEKQIGERYGVHINTVRKRLQRYGIRKEG